MSSPAVSMGPSSSDTVDVRWEDQQKINSFAKSNAEYRELRAELEDLQKQRQKLEDAGDELLMADEDAAQVMVLVGEVFMHKTPDEVTDALEEKKAAADAEIMRLDGEITKLKNTMRELKAHLYARFGTNINLEHEEEKE